MKWNNIITGLSMERKIHNNRITYYAVAKEIIQIYRLWSDSESIRVMEEQKWNASSTY